MADRLPISTHRSGLTAAAPRPACPSTIIMAPGSSMLAANDNAPLPDWGDDSFEAVSARTAMLLSRIPRSPGYGI